MLFIAFFIYEPIFGETQSSDLAQALQLANEGKRREAIKKYEGILATGESSGDVFYNLGTLHLQEKQIARAILYLEKAIKHQPRNADARTNLEIAQSDIDDPIFAISPFFLVSYWRGFSNILPMVIWGLLSLLFLGGLVFAVNKSLFSDISKKKKWITISIAFTGLILSLAAAFTRYNAVKNDSYAIVMSEVDRLEGPDANSKNEEFPLISEGIKVQIKDSYENYYKVKLPDSDESWIPKDKLERI